MKIWEQMVSIQSISYYFHCFLQSILLNISEQVWTTCDTIKGNESLVEKKSIPRFLCQDFVNAKDNIKQKNLNTVFANAISQKQYLRHPTQFLLIMSYLLLWCITIIDLPLQALGVSSTSWVVWCWLSQSTHFGAWFDFVKCWWKNKVHRFLSQCNICNLTLSLLWGVNNTKVEVMIAWCLKSVQVFVIPS